MVGSARGPERPEIGGGEASTGAAARTGWIVAVEAASIAGLGALLVALALRLGASRPTGAALVASVVAMPLVAIVAADLVSGLVHWACDRGLDPTWPVIGPLVVAPFREHHERPEAMTRHGHLELCGNNALALQPLHLAAWRPLAAGPDAAAFALDLFLLVFAAAIALTNHVHRWAHAGRVPPAVRALQRAGLLLRPGAHATHHRPPYDRAFCVTTGWLNPLLDRTGLFVKVERALRGAYWKAMLIESRGSSSGASGAASSSGRGPTFAASGSSRARSKS